MKNKTVQDRFVIISLFLLDGLFFAYWCILAFYSQLHFDDLHFLWKMREMSVFDFVKEMYFSRSGRFVGYAVNGVVSVVTDKLGFHQLWTLFYYALGLGVCWLVIKDIKLPVTRMALFLGMCFLYDLFILTNIDFPVFFWLCAMSYYLGLPMACLLLKYLNMRNLNGWQWAVLLIITVTIGGGSEAFTPIVLLLMFFSGVYWWYSKGWNVKETWALAQVRRIVWVAVVILVLFAVVVAAPGNYVRMSDTTQFVHPVGLLGWIKAVADVVVMFFYFMAFYIPYYLIVFFLAYYLGAKTDIVLPVSKGKMVMGIAVAFLAYLILSSLPNVYLYGGFGIQRSYTHIVLAMMLSVLTIGFALGVEKKPEKTGWCVVGGMVALSVIMVINIVKDTPSARAYSKAVDERIERLCELRGKGQMEKVVVSPLPIPYTEDPKHLILQMFGKDTPRSVLYYISETDTVPNEYEYHMKRVLNLDFDFVLDESGFSDY